MQLKLYIKYQNEYSNEKIKFSNFAELRTKWCVFAESNGIHTVGMCSYFTPKYETYAQWIKIEC